MKKIKALIIRTAGTNCDQETAFAFKKTGAKPNLVHINEILKNPDKILSYQIMAFPGGFTYGDDIASGKILANEIKNKMDASIKKFINNGCLIIGICNGFQVLVKAGYLPMINFKNESQATLSFNNCGKFEDRWIYLKRPEKTLSVWAQGLPKVITLPIAHGEGKFVPKDTETLKLLKENNQIVFQYSTIDGRLSKEFPVNPNGSVENIAGICDPSGRIFGLMPHPERFMLKTQHPRWTREKIDYEPFGITIFRNGVKYAEKNL